MVWPCSPAFLHPYPIQPSNEVTVQSETIAAGTLVTHSFQARGEACHRRYRIEGVVASNVWCNCYRVTDLDTDEHEQADRAVAHVLREIPLSRLRMLRAASAASQEASQERVSPKVGTRSTDKGHVPRLSSMHGR